MITATIAVFLVNLAASARWSIIDQYSNLEFTSKYRATGISALNMLVSLLFIGLSFFLGKMTESAGVQTVMLTLGIFTILTLIPTSVAIIRHHNNGK